MSSCRVYLNGNIKGLEHALRLKLENDNITVKKISEQVALVDSDSIDLMDQIFYIKGTEIFDGIVVTDVQEATENDKTTASSMGFEVINKEDALSNTTTVSKVLDDSNSNVNAVFETKVKETVFDRKQLVKMKTSSVLIAYYCNDMLIYRKF